MSAQAINDQTCHQWRLLCIGLCTVFFTVTAAAADIWVITDREHPVMGPRSRVIELDVPDRIKAELATDLPSDPKQAAAIVQQRLKQDGGKLQQRLAGAYQGVADAWALGVTQIPAVVIDRRYVIYGETDVGRAVSRIEAYRRKQP
jgi:integrating conjugative element protein (TIGR03757 family)